jgi:hypothetical protein
MDSRLLNDWALDYFRILFLFLMAEVYRFGGLNFNDLNTKSKLFILEINLVGSEFFITWL